MFSDNHAFIFGVLPSYAQCEGKDCYKRGAGDGKCWGAVKPSIRPVSYRDSSLLPLCHGHLEITYTPEPTQ